MPHDTPLIATIVAGLGLAFVFGALANRFRIPPLVGSAANGASEVLLDLGSALNRGGGEKDEGSDKQAAKHHPCLASARERHQARHATG